MSMWQKARIINSHSLSGIEGREIWVTDKPFLIGGFHPVTGEPASPVMALRTNLLNTRGNRLAVTLEDIELLGGEDAFAGEVPQIPFLDWIGEQEGKRQ